MEDEILSINPSRSVLTDPYVIRLPDGHVRITATSILFPETCPRCGSSPANTTVSLSSGGESSQSIKLPFCRRCGWALNITQYSFVVAFCAFFFFVFPHLRIPIPSWLSGIPSSIVVIVVFLIIGLVSQLIFKMIFKPGVEVVVAEKDSIELSFDDQMYADKFVELNR
jgi:hypothetical protein